MPIPEQAAQDDLGLETFQWGSLRRLALVLVGFVLLLLMVDPSGPPAPGSAPATAPAPQPADGQGISWSTLLPSLGLFVFDMFAAYGSCALLVLRPRLVVLVAVVTAIAGVQLGSTPFANQVSDYIGPLVPVALAGENFLLQSEACVRLLSIDVHRMAFSLLLQA
jgi:hypothetical protein